MISFLLSAVKIIFLLGFLILIHETGHLIVAKLCKVKVNEFAIGFGPTIFRKQGKETKYALRLIPLGGFCSMEGEEQRSETEGSFSQASIPKRLAIVVAGASVNIIFGLVVYFILTASTGNYVTNIVDSTIEGYPAQEIGLQQEDKIIEIDGNKINNIYDIENCLDKIQNEKVKLKIERNGEVKEYTIKPEGIIGVILKRAEDTFINHLLHGGIKTKNFAFSIIDNIKMLFTGKVGVDQMIGPIGISEVVAKTSGFQEFIYLLALISLSLGVTNLLPIPALDGGKVVILLVEAIRKKPLDEELEIKIQLAGFSILILLSIYVAYNDILRIF